MKDKIAEYITKLKVDNIERMNEIESLDYSIGESSPSSLKHATLIAKHNNTVNIIFSLEMILISELN